MNEPTPNDEVNNNSPIPTNRPSKPYSPESPMEKYYGKSPSSTETPLAKPEVPQKTEEPVPARENSTAVKGSRLLKYSLISIAFALPLSIIFYVWYWNYLPFGYSKTYTLVAGSENDTTGEIYFEPSRNLSEKKAAIFTDKQSQTYREVYGDAKIIFKPKAVIKGTNIKLELTGENVAIIPPYIDTKSLEKETWDNSWDFSKKIPAEFTGDSYSFDGCAQFLGKNRLTLVNSENKYESKPFSLFVEWTPTDASNSNQQIIGHFNWEIYQNKGDVTFQVGRMNNKNGPFYSVKIPIDKNFFNKKHALLAVYSPAEYRGSKGYISLFIDDKYAQTDIGEDLILEEYGQKPLSLGWSSHNGETNPYFKGCIYAAKIVDKKVFQNLKQTNILMEENSVAITITNTAATGTIRILEIKADE